MINTLALVGRLVSAPRVVNEGDKEITLVRIAVTRIVKDEEGVYKDDFFDIYLPGQIGNAVMEYCHFGDLIAVKTRIETEVQDDDKIELKIIGEKVTFLSKTEKDDE